MGWDIIKNEMKEFINIVVLDVFDENKGKDNVETYSNILASNNVFDRQLIENEDLLKQALTAIIYGNSDNKRDQFTDAIVDNFDKFDLSDHLVNYLTYRYEKDERFNGVSFIASKLGKLEHLGKVIIEDYKMLRNPFMYRQDLFFQGHILQDFIDNPRAFDHKENQIILKGPDGELAYAILNSDDQVLIRELSRLGREWFIRGVLNFDQDLKMNVIDVTKVYSDL
jgi:hypothetical protein